jgi:hypothetical protein
LSTRDHLANKYALVILFEHDPVDSIEPTDSTIAKAPPDHDFLIMLHGLVGILGEVSLAWQTPHSSGSVISNEEFGFITERTSTDPVSNSYEPMPI